MTLALVWVGLCVALLPARATPEFLAETWLTDHGMPQNSVTAIAQTPDGYLWITTRNAGLARYDGAHFTAYSPLNTPTLQSFELLRLSLHDHGALLVTDIEGNITRLDDGVFSRVPKPATPDPAWLRAAMPSPHSRLVDCTFPGSSGRPLWPGAGGPWEVDREGVIWFCSPAGTLMRSANGAAEVMSPAEGVPGTLIQCVAMDAAGRIWVGTDRGLAVWDGGQFRDMTPTNGAPEVSIQGMAFSGDGGLWLDTGNHLLKCRDRRWLAQSPPLEDRFRQLPHRRWVHGDAQGGAWLIHFTGGVFHVDARGEGRPIHYADGTPVTLANCWYQDREQNIWLGLENRGLLRLRPRLFSPALASGQIDYQPKTICEDSEGTWWVGTADGHLLRWSGDVMQVIRTPYRGEVAVHPARDGGVWVGTVADGVFAWKSDRLEPVALPGQPYPAIRTLIEDRRGWLWLGGENGLFCLRPDGLSQVSGTPESGPYILAMAEGPDGEIWFGTATSQLGRVRNGTVDFFEPADRSELCRFWSLLADKDGTVWVGTLGGGLLRFRDGRFTRLTMRDGLPDETICQILDDGRGWLWLGCRSGISRVERTTLEARAAGSDQKIRCLTYGREDGLPTLESSAGMQPASWAGRGGRLWFSMTMGAVSVDPAGVSINPLPPLMTIEQVYVDGAAQLVSSVGGAPIAQHPPDRRKPLRIGPGNHYLEIQYAGLSFAAVEKVRFRHRLEGLDEHWVEAGRRRTVRYDHLPPGDYVFRVQACNNDGIWNETGAAFGFVVEPFLWQRWWFQAGAAAMVLGLVIAAVRVRERHRARHKLEQLERSHAIERERARIARDIHDELGSSLTRITALSDSTQELLDPQSPPAANLRRIRATARALTRSMSEIVWAVNPKHDRLDSLVSYVEAFAQDFLASAQIRSRFEFPRHLPTLAIGVPARYKVFLAFKEALTNVVKHSGATETRIALSIETGRFTLSVEDNGRGFAVDTSGTAEPTPSPNGNGLANMRTRLEEVGGRCEIRSEAGSGTCVRLTVPTVTDRLETTHHGNWGQAKSGHF